MIQIYINNYNDLMRECESIITLYDSKGKIDLWLFHMLWLI